METSLFDLRGEIAVVIGATGILGGTLARGLAAAGAAVAVVGRDSTRGLARVSEIESEGGQAAFFRADALQRAELDAVRNSVQDLWGVPSILLNAAGGNDPRVTITESNAVELLDLSAWRENFDLNLIGGVLLPCQVFGPAFVATRKGSIINIASVAAHQPLSRVISYSAAKASVLNLTQFLAREWAPSGVRVNSITPGFFPAEQNRKLLFGEDGTPTARARAILGHTPMGRFGEARELVGAALFLASHRASSFVTGSDIRVDGGFLSQTI